MRKLIESQKVVHFLDRDSRAIFSDTEYRHCYFESCCLSITRKPRLRSKIKNVKLLDCETRGCSLDTAIIEDVLIDGLKTNGLLQAWGAVYKHVTFKGKIGEIMLSPFVATATATKRQQRKFDKANSKFYETVDWAIDIREALFLDGEIQGVPARLIRRDPETQVVVTREKALEGQWRSLDLSKTHWDTSLEFLLDRGEPDVVLVAPKRNRRFKDLLDGLKLLRDAGIAEPD